MFKFFLLLCILVSSLFSKDYLFEHSKRNDINVSKQYINLEKEFKVILNNHKQDILNKWPSAELNTPYKLVQYLDNYNSKIVINFKSKKLHIEVLLENEKLAQDKIKSLIKKTMALDIKTYLKENYFIKKLYSKLQIVDNIELENVLIISDVMNNNQKDTIINNIILQDFQETIHNNHKIYKVSTSLPEMFTQDKLKTYKEDIEYYSKQSNIPNALLYSIIHSNTYFNPLAINYNEITFGLSQLNPKNIGENVYRKIHIKDKFITPRYLYHASNNINLSAKYLDILYNQEFQNIKNINSRIYCTVIAYKFGIQTLHNIFKDKDTYNKIDNLLDSKVYKSIIRKLYKKKDKLYFSKIVLKIKKYKTNVKNT